MIVCIRPFPVPTTNKWERFVFFSLEGLKDIHHGSGCDEAPNDISLW